MAEIKKRKPVEKKAKENDLVKDVRHRTIEVVDTLVKGMASDDYERFLLELKADIDSRLEAIRDERANEEAGD